MTLRITTLYPEYQRIQTTFETCPKDDNASCKQPVQKLAFKRAPIDPELYADVMQMRQNCAEYASTVNNLNARADDKRKYKPGFGVLKNKEGKPDYLKTGVYALSFLPPCRRMQSSFDAAEDENYFRVAGMAAVAAANFPNDMREIALAYNELKDIKSLKDFKGQEFQYRSSFFKGTFLERLTQKFKWLNRIDKTLYETKVGQGIKKLLQLELLDEGQNIKGIGKLTNDMPAIGFKGGLFKQVMGKSLLRINIIGLGLSCLFELPAIIYSARKGDSFGEKTKSVIKQSLKSVGNVALITGGITMTGALFFSGTGFTASLLGMSVGSTLGILASKGLNKIIDKIF